MIASLRGKVLEVHASSALVEVAGIGYAIKAPVPVLTALKAGEERFFYVHDHVREDAHDLFAFTTRDELSLFERLLSVSGVGPKVALTVMSSGTSAAVRGAILKGDLAMLTSVPGVGTKTAQKIVLELKGQIVDPGDVPPGDAEVLEALVSLGYAAAQAREALKAVPKNVTDVSERVREALKRLAK